VRFQVWRLTVREDRSATLVCDGGNDSIVYTQHIEFTDFPIPEITLWFANNRDLSAERALTPPARLAFAGAGFFFFLQMAPNLLPTVVARPRPMFLFASLLHLGERIARAPAARGVFDEDAFPDEVLDVAQCGVLRALGELGPFR